MIEPKSVNPLATDPLALANSCYARPYKEQLLIGEQAAPRPVQELHSALRAVLHDPDFPCVGAKSLVNQSSYRFGLYSELGDHASTAGLARDLYTFIAEREHIEGEFKSFIACFHGPKLRKMREFDRLLWQQLAGLNRIDRSYHAWNPEVSSDVGDPEFSFSFGGAAFFIVGLSPCSPRWARRFPWPALVFNDHFQFEKLREEQSFDRFRDLIRGRDSKLHGSSNPMLSDYGVHSEARQYSGRQVKDGWQCPVHFDSSET